VGDQHWHEKMDHIADWFMCGNVKFFEEVDEALSWLKPD